MADTGTASRIRLLRESRKLTQQQVADALGVPKSTYVHYEDGTNEPKISVLIKIALYYEISADWLLGVESAQTKNLPPETRWEIMRKEIEQLSDDDVKELHSFLKFLLWREKQQD